MPRAPASIMVVSILGIIYAAALLLLMPCSMFLVFHPLQPSAASSALKDDPVYVANLVISSIIWIPLMLTLLIGSVGSLKLKPVGRRLMLIFAWAQIILGVVGSLVGLVIVLPRTTKAFAADPILSASSGMLEVFTIVTALASVLFYIGVSAIIIYFFNRKIAIDAFNGIFPPSESAFPVQQDGPPAQFQ